MLVSDLPFDGDGAAGIPAAPIGEILSEEVRIDAGQVLSVLEYQRRHGVKFGEAAVALGLVSVEDLTRALSRQFRYSMARSGSTRLAPELVVLNRPFTSHAEAIRSVRTQLLLRLGGVVRGDLVPAALSVAITSASAGDGKSYLAANLGAALAQLGRSTIVVDAHLRRPRMSEMFGISNRVGLSGVLIGRTIESAICAVEGVPGLSVLPSGATPPNPLELLQSANFARLMRHLAGSFECLVVDTAGASEAMDGVVAAGQCRSAVIVGRRNRDRLEDVRRLADQLQVTGCPVAGVVLNDQ